jgi:hypothetical protein
MRYAFKIQKQDDTIADVQSLVLPDVASAWSEVVEIAQGLDDIGGRIIVTDDNGEVVIHVDVATSCNLLSGPKSMKPALTLRCLAVR